MVLITKEDGKDFRGIGIVEVMWKVTTSIINCQLTSEIRYHDNLHGFRTGREVEKTTLKDKLLQEMKAVR